MIVTAACGLMLSGCGGAHTTKAHSTLAQRSSASKLIDLATVGPLRAQFERDAGHPRLLVLFSPT